MNDRERTAYEIKKALQEVRDTHAPGSKAWEVANLLLKKAETEYHRARD